MGPRLNACKNNTTGLKPTTDFLYWHERDAIRQAVFERDPPFCVWCHVPVGDHRHDNPFTVDHITPRSEGGRYIPENLVLSCGPCNSRRRNLSVLQFIIELV